VPFVYLLGHVSSKITFDERRINVSHPPLQKTLEPALRLDNDSPVNQTLILRFFTENHGALNSLIIRVHDSLKSPYRIITNSDNLSVGAIAHNRVLNR